MRRLVISILLIMLYAHCAYAWQRIPPFTHEARLHWRVPVERLTDRAALCVAVGDTMSHRSFLVKKVSDSRHDIMGRSMVQLNIGTDSTVVFAVDGDHCDISFKLTTVATDCYKLEIGSKKAEYSEIVEAQGLPLWCDKRYNGRGKVLRNDLEFIENPGVLPSRFASIETLKSYIAKSTDPIEGIWNHYDQTSPALRVSNATRYSVAVVAADDSDGYEIILVDAAGKIDPRWKPLSIKGRLKDTGLADIYALEWYDMRGARADVDATAQLAGNILTLRFPYWDTTVIYVKSNKTN